MKILSEIEVDFYIYFRELLNLSSLLLLYLSSFHLIENQYLV